MEKEPKRAFKGIWIPVEIWKSENLSITEKIFLAEIESLSKNKNGCFASNTYFSKFFKLSKSRVSGIISELVKKDYLHIFLEKKDKQIVRRFLKIKINKIKKDFKESVKKQKKGDSIGVFEDSIGSQEIGIGVVRKQVEPIPKISIAYTENSEDIYTYYNIELEHNMREKEEKQKKENSHTQNLVPNLHYNEKNYIFGGQEELKLEVEYQPNEKALVLAKKIKDNVLQIHNGQRQIPDELVKDWAFDIENLEKKKGLEWGNIERLFGYALQDNFHRGNMVSGQYFFRNIDKIAGDLKKSENQAPKSSPIDYWASKEAPEGYIYNRLGELARIQEEATQEEKEQARKEREIFEKEAEEKRGIERQKELEKKEETKKKIVEKKWEVFQAKMEQDGSEVTQEEKDYWWLINGELCEEEYENYITSPQEEEQKQQQWARNGIEKEYFKEDLKTYYPKTQSQKEAKNLIERLIGGEIKNLVFCGSNGVGKSHLAVSAVKALGGKLTTIFKIGLEIRTSFESKGKTEADILGEYAKLPFLCIDELGRSKGGEADMNYLSYIVDQRNSRGLRTMFCTNLHQSKNCPEGGKCKKCLRSYLSTDVMSRLNEKGKVVTIQGEDYRKLY